MLARCTGELYNRTDPPKKVDVMQCFLLTFPDRTANTIYTVEHLIEGETGWGQ